jgi:hypothetical protein
MRIVTTVMTACALSLLLPGCPKKDEEKEEPKKPKKEEPEDEGEASLQVAAGDPPVDGPMPPDESMVLFSVEGALYPLACFNKDKGKILAHEDCLDLVPSGAEVRLSSIESEYNKVAGDKVEPQCLAGSGKKIAVGVEGITEGAQFVFGTFPRQAMRGVTFIEDETLEPSNKRLSDEEKEKLAAASGGMTAEEIESHQVVEIDADGDGKDDKIYSVFAPDPKVSEQYKWSGIFLAKGGDLGSLELLEKSKTKRDVFEARGVFDLNGDEKNELWIRLVFEEGAGDRVYAIDSGSPKPIGNWSCGAAR